MIALQRPDRILLLLACLLTLLGPAWSESGNDVAAANSLMQRAESNLQLVDGSIGHLTKPPTGSAAKLGRVRLDQALADLEGADKILTGLTSGAGLTEARTRYSKADELYKKLDGILTGKSSPPQPEPKPETPPVPEPKPDGPNPAPKPAPDAPAPKDPVKEAPKPPATVKLGYPHADNFKNTLFTLRRVEGDVNAILQLWAELLPVEDQLGINHRKTVLALGTITETTRQAGFVKDGLAKIPANGEGVAEAQRRLADAQRSLSEAAGYFEPLNARLLALVDLANYPEYHNDLKRLSELSSAYRDPEQLFRDMRPRAAEAFAQAAASKAECVRIAQAYRRLIEQETEDGKRLEGAGNSFLENHAAFLAAAEEQSQKLPADIRADLAKIDRMAEEAVANQQPMWFTGGIPDQVSWVDDKFALYAALDPAGSAGLAPELEAAKASLRKRADSLRELIIRENPLPADNFAGADRDAAIAIAVDAWKHQEPGFELLAVRIPAQAWARNTNWSYSNGTWYFSDVSSLQVRLIVADKANPAQAIDRPINVRKDHQKSDTLIGVPMRSIDEALQPNEYLLRSRLQ